MKLRHKVPATVLVQGEAGGLDILYVRDETTDETIERWDQEIAAAKCSVCGNQATDWREDGAFGIDVDIANPIVEKSIRCHDRRENTGPLPES